MPPGGHGDMGSLLKQAKMMETRMKEAERALAERVVEGSSGGGVVKVFLNGALEIKGVKIAKDAVDPDDVEGLEALVEGAVRQALVAAKQLKASEMAKITGGLTLPGLGF